jgi:hypothetical protein
MSYLNNYPVITYGTDILTDITRKVVIHQQIRDNASIWTEYKVNDGEDLTDVSYNFYGSTEYTDMIMLMNDIIDPFFGWVLDNETFNAYLIDVYGLKVNDVHHYEKDGIVVHNAVTGAQPISNYDYEFLINEKKRRIRILNPEYLDLIINERNVKIRQELRDKQAWQ